MQTHYKHLGPEERATLMLMRQDGHSLTTIAQQLKRSASTLSRELRRNSITTDQPYDAAKAGRRARAKLFAPRKTKKLAAGSHLLNIVSDLIKLGWSPQQINGRLRDIFPDRAEMHVSHETIYTALYAMPRGELRKELIRCLRQGHDGRRSHGQGEDRRGKLPNMLSIHERPPEVESRLVPGHWEADLIKGAGNKSSVATLVERTTRFVILAKMPNATAEATLEALTMALNRIDAPLRQTLTYDQGREMSRHAELTERTGMTVYFADPHSPWQRGSNENMNGLIRQYLPKGTDLSVHSQEYLDAIAHSLNTRPRAVLNFKMPIEVYAAITAALAESTSVTKH
jgi:IS30 family transposase